MSLYHSKAHKHHAYWHAMLLCLVEKFLWMAFVAIIALGYIRLGRAALFAIPPSIALLFIYRFYLSHHLMKMVRKDDPSAILLSGFPRLLLASCIRLGSGLLWGIPFALVMLRLYQYIFVLPAPVFNSDFTKIGAILSPSAASDVQMYIGTLVFFLALFIAFLIFIYGWRRGLCFDFQHVNNITLKKTLRNTRYARRKARKTLFMNFLLHAVLCLPSIILPLLLPYLKLQSLLTGRVMNDLQMIYVFLKAGIISDGTLLFSCIIFVVLYLPLLPYRKLRNASAVVNCYERNIR